MMPLLEVDSLTVSFGDTSILRGVSFTLEAGKTLGVVGESGCGKTMTGLSLIGMTPRTATVGGSMKLNGRELNGLREREWLDIRGQDISMVMQDPFTSLNPMHRVGDQIAEVLILHHGASKREAWNEAVQMLKKVGVPSPEQSARKYPHQMSGGQRQRVVLAIAFAGKPKLLIADEPTTALDVTLQAQILRLIRDLQQAEGTGVILISHDIGVIASLADEIAVFYAGRIVEYGPAEAVLRHTGHPYTQALLAAVPKAGAERLEAIPGQPPNFKSLDGGCSFRPRCRYAFERCVQEPGLIPMNERHAAACWKVAASSDLSIPAGSGK
ncbi:MAG: Oligopeptide transport ATP-binding protein OppD [Fimbriimonadaceae bacterium]|nr:Oligopeptide transport ATP-binding protein OppD [Fimbriimonadaceae bacterium]